MFFIKQSRYRHYHISEVKCVNFLQLFRILQNINSATRDERILDLVISNEPGMVEELEVIEPLASSDHNMITWIVSRGCDYGEVSSGDRLDYRRVDFEGMRKN